MQQAAPSRQAQHRKKGTAKGVLWLALFLFSIAFKGLYLPFDKKLYVARCCLSMVLSLTLYN